MNEEDNLSEEGLGEVIKKQDKKLKEDLDEINYRNKELERRQKEQQPDIPGLFEARSGFRTGTGLAFEILANTGLDAFSLIPGSQQAGSAFINYLAQKIRGGEVSKGEILAAAATSQIPGLSQARALTRGGRFARNVAKGGIAGGVTTTSMSLVDEGELPSFGEFATGVTGGGLLGGAFDLAPAAVTGKLGSEVSEIAGDTGFFLKQLQRRVQGGDLIFDPAVYRAGSFATDGTIAAAKINAKGFNPDITKKNLQLFNEIGFTGTNKLDIQDMLYGIDEAGKPLMSQYKRRILKAGIGDETFNWSTFTKNRDEVAKNFLDGLQDLNIDPKTIHGHHISALRITSSLFDGLSPIQRKKLIKVFQREGLQLGNHPANLLALHKSTHLEVVHPFLEQQVGKYGQLLMDPVKMKKLNPRQREGLVKKFAKIIKRSEEIAMENTQTWLSETFENMSPEAAFDAKLDILNKAFDNDITFRTQLLESVKSKEPLLPYQAEDVEISGTPKAKKTRVTSKKTKFKNLLKQIKTENPNSKQMTIWDISEEALDAYRKLF